MNNLIFAINMLALIIAVVAGSIRIERAIENVFETPPCKIEVRK